MDTKWGWVKDKKGSEKCGGKGLRLKRGRGELGKTGLGRKMEGIWVKKRANRLEDQFQKKRVGAKNRGW